MNNFQQALHSYPDQSFLRTLIASLYLYMNIPGKYFDYNFCITKYEARNAHPVLPLLE